MYAKKPKSRLWLLMLVLLAAVGTLIGVAVGKYIKTTTYTGNLSVKAELAENIELLESEANRQPDGSYVLDTTNSVTKNTYTLIPGLDIPKDPHIIITNKTPIDAYLFVEVVDNTPNTAIGYAMSENWLPLGIAGKNGGSVYVYTTDGSIPAIVDEAVGATFTVHLLKNNEITVGQKLLSAATNDTLTFYAAMGEVAASDLTDPIAKTKAIYATIQ